VSREEEQFERRATAKVQRLAVKFAEAAEPLWHMGDGYGGFVLKLLDEAFTARGLTGPPRGDRRRRDSVSRELRDRVIARDGLVCQYCKANLMPSEATIDHVVPVSRGGSDDLENLRVACRKCNVKKGAGDAVV